MHVPESNKRNSQVKITVVTPIKIYVSESNKRNFQVKINYPNQDLHADKQ